MFVQVVIKFREIWENRFRYQFRLLKYKFFFIPKKQKIDFRRGEIEL